MAYPSGSSSVLPGFVDSWSTPNNQIDLPAVAAARDFPSVTVSGLPTGITIQKVIAMLKVRAIENTNAGGSNAIVGAQTINIKTAAGAWGTNDIAAIDLVDNEWTLAASTREMGDVKIGARDVKSVVSRNGTYDFRNLAAQVDLASLRLNDVIMGLRVYFTKN